MDAETGVVLYDYAATEEDELTIHEGDSFSLLQTFDDDWWLVKVNQSVGLVPSNYVKLSTASNNPHERTLTRQNSQELVRLQNMREETAMKIDALR